jgi:hypothetical protein
MNKERNLLPWILSGLSLATAAAVITVAFFRGPLTAGLPSAGVMPPQAPSASVAPLPADAAEVVPAAAPRVAASTPDLPPEPQPAEQAQSAAEPPLQGGQIWECTTNGVKTFSNNPCGENSSLIELRPINTMNPAPDVHYARPYTPEPRYAPPYADQNAYADQDPYPDQGNAESVGNSYAVVPGYVFLPRHRPDHESRPEHQRRPEHERGAEHERNAEHEHPQRSLPPPPNSAPPMRRN